MPVLGQWHGRCRAVVKAVRVRALHPQADAPVSGRLQLLTSGEDAFRRFRRQRSTICRAACGVTPISSQLCRINRATSSSVRSACLSTGRPFRIRAWHSGRRAGMTNRCLQRHRGVTGRRVAIRQQASGSRREGKGLARRTNGRHAFHGGLDLADGAIMGSVGHRPFLPQPVTRLLGGGDFLRISGRRHDN